jgi:phosphohistidine swiveling domain-containing protein
MIEFIIDGAKLNLEVTRNMSFWHEHLSDYGHYYYSKLYGLKTPLQQTSIVRGGKLTSVFINCENSKQYSDDLWKLVTAPIKLKRLINQYQILRRKLINDTDRLAININKQNWHNFCQSYAMLCAGLHITTSLGRIGTDKLTMALQNAGVPKEVANEYISRITYPDENTPYIESRIELMNIVVKCGNDQQKRDELVALWLTKYKHIPVNFCGSAWDKNYVLTEIENISKPKAMAEIKKIQNNHVANKAARNKLFKQINDEEVTKVATILQITANLNEQRKNTFCYASMQAHRVFEFVAKKIGAKSWEIGFFLTPDEIGHIIEGGYIDPIAILLERKQIGCAINHRGVLRTLTKAEVDKGIKVLEDGIAIECQSNEIKGLGASRGKVIGAVKIVNNASEMSKVSIGDILVAPMTSVDYLTIMGKAAAFVTNEGGITSHAAIVSRELGKPCVVGTKNATQVFKDGDMVEVDANKGIVRKI